METIIFSVGLLGVAFLLHLLIWRVCLPKRQTLVLLLIFFGIFGLGSLVGLIFKAGGAPQSFVQWLQLAFFYIPSALSYIALYSAIEEDSPSLLLVNEVHRSGDKGCSYDEFSKIISNELFI